MTTEDASKLFVAGLSETASEESLRELFEGVGGTVISLSLPKDRLTGRPRGFGFVTLGSPEQALAARDSLDGSLQAGRAISVRPFEAGPQRREPRPDVAPQNTGSRTVYVGNLPYDVTQEEIQHVFEEQCGAPPVRVHLPVGPDGRMRGFGFVSVATDEAAAAAVDKLTEFVFRGRRLVVNLAHPKIDRSDRNDRGGDRSDRSDRAERSDSGADRGDRRPASALKNQWRDAAGPVREVPVALPPRDDFFEPAKPLEGRRARAEVKPKKAKEKRKASERAGKKGRGGGSTWHNWADLDEDE